MEQWLESWEKKEWKEWMEHRTWSLGAGRAAALLGHLDVLIHVATTNPDVLRDAAELSHAAAVGGQLAVLDWLSTDYVNYHDSWLCAMAALGGHVSLLATLRARGYAWNEYTCAKAAEGRHLNLLQWARAHGCPWDEHTCEKAAWTGHLNLLQWARSQGCPWDTHTCASAAVSGHLDVLQWARSQGCPWDDRTCWHAAQRGHLVVLQWARSQGCPWDEYEVTLAAVAARQYHVVVWLLKQNQSLLGHVQERFRVTYPNLFNVAFYYARTELAQQYAVVWPTETSVWLRALDDVAQVLTAGLPTDLIRLILQYC